MEPLLVDLTKEIVVGFLGTVLAWLWGHVRRLASDLNAFFGKVRYHDSRLQAIESKLGIVPPPPPCSRDQEKKP